MAKLVDWGSHHRRVARSSLTVSSHCDLSLSMTLHPLFRTDSAMPHILQGSHRLEKYLNLEGFFEKSLKIKYALKSTGK